MLSENRLIIESFYDQQKVRQETANRLRVVVRTRLEGIDRNQPEQKKPKSKKAYGKKWTDKQLKTKLNKAKEKKLLEKADYCYLDGLLEMIADQKANERKYQSKIKYLIAKEPIWLDYLSKVRGIGPILSANLISYLGYCENFDTLSKLWRYCGLAVIEGKAERRAKGKKIHYNPRLKTLCYKISDCFIKQGGKYRELYVQFKASYKQAHPEPIPRPNYDGHGFKQLYTPIHIDLMTRRKLVKLFLSHYWQTARAMKKLPCRPLYVMEKLDHSTIIKPFVDGEKL